MNLANMMDYHHFPIYSVMVLFLGAFIIAASGSRASKNPKNPAGFRAWIALCATALSLFFLGSLVRPVMLEGEVISYWMGSRGIAGGYAIGIALEVDALSLFFALLISTAVFVSAIYSIRYMVHDECVPQYYVLYCMLAGGVLGLVLSGDIFNMFIMVEILTFAAVALTSFRTKVFGALEAAFKYLVVGCMGSTAILTGVIMLYAQYHTLNLAQLANLVPGTMNNATKLAFAFLYIGFSTKAFIVPFHPLAADAHGAAPASISVLISGVLTKSGIYGIIRLTYFLFQTMNLGSMQFMLVFIGSVSMFVCVTMALAQHDFKRLLAYHSISQIGYVLAAVGLSTSLGISAGLYHAMNHTLFKGLLFLAAGAVLHETGTTDLGKLGGLAKKMPHTTVLFLIGAFSISGVPPFNGFASKWMIYQATYQKAVETNNIGFLLVTIVALVTSTLTLASFVKVSQSVFFGQMPKEYENVKEVPFGMRLAMGILACLCIVTGLFPKTVTGILTEPAAKAVANVGEYITAMGFKSNLPAPNVTFAQVGVWEPINWLLILCIALLALTVVAVAGKYDRVSEHGGPLGAAIEMVSGKNDQPAVNENGEVDTKYQLFYGGEKNVYSQVGGGDLFWGFKHNWRHYFDFMHNLHSGIVNDYALWAVVALALAIVYMMIVL